MVLWVAEAQLGCPWAGLTWGLSLVWLQSDASDDRLESLGLGTVGVSIFPCGLSAWCLHVDLLAEEPHFLNGGSGLPTAPQEKPFQGLVGRGDLPSITPTALWSSSCGPALAQGKRIKSTS